jgi:hypothetical protein
VGNFEYEIPRIRKLKQKPIKRKFTEQTLLYLIFDWFRHGALLIASMLFGAFAIGQLLALSRGLTILCGCFGTFSHNVTWFSFSTLLAMGAVTIVLLRFGPEVDAKQ